MTFKDLAIGQRFDFVSPDIGYNSFYYRCIKISPRRYRSVETQIVYMIGTTKCVVFNPEDMSNANNL